MFAIFAAPAASGLMDAAHNAAEQRHLLFLKERRERMARRMVDTINIDVNDENKNRLTLPLTPKVPLSEADYGGGNLGRRIRLIC